MTQEELESAKSSFEELQALEKKRKQLQEELKAAEIENDRTRKEKEGLLKVQEGQRDDLLAEATKLKEELLSSSTPDGKVPPELMEKMQNVQRRLAAMGLAAGATAD